MKPHIDGTEFGRIVIAGESFNHDVVIRLSGKVKKRKKKLSKEVFGTSHTISREEVEAVYDEGAELLIFGTGQEGVAKMSGDALAFLKEKGCEVIAMRTPDAIEAWNEAKGMAIGLFHITC